MYPFSPPKVGSVVTQVRRHFSTVFRTQLYSIKQLYPYQTANRMDYTPVLINFLNSQAKSYLHFFQTFSIHMSLLGPTPPPPKIKISKNIPIFKADDETDTSNHRPIS